MAQITSFGHLDGKEVRRAVLSDGDVSVSILSLGCITQDWRVGNTPVVLGLTSLDDYCAHSRSFGIIAGRVANRIKKGRFTLDGKTYSLPVNNNGNHLHGGPGGLGSRVWDMEATDKAARLTIHSPDGEMGYPAAVDFEVVITLDGHSLTYDMKGMPDAPTPINLAQHNYYNLNCGGDVRRHEVFVDADRYTETDDLLIPTGTILPIDDTRMDFRVPISIAARDPGAIGIDDNLILREGRNTDDPAAVVVGDETGLRLQLWTQEPGVQLYNAPQMDVPVPGLDGIHYGPFAGLCLEAQHYPDSVNHPDFPSTIRTPDAPYHQIYRVAIG